MNRDSYNEVRSHNSGFAKEAVQCFDCSLLLKVATFAKPQPENVRAKFRIPIDLRSALALLL